MSVASPFEAPEKRAGATFNEQFGVELPEHFGDPLREYEAVRTGAGLVDLSFRGLLALAGSERLRWLNGQITNDVKDLKAGEGKLAAVLTVKGHILSDLAVYGLADSVWIDLNRDRAPLVRETFDRHIIADDAAVEDASDRWAHLMLVGPAAGTLMAEAAGTAMADLAPWQHAEVWLGDLAARIIASRWLAMPGYDILVPVERAGTAWGALLEAGRGHRLRPVGMAALRILRVEAGWRWCGADFDDGNLLMESLTQDHVSFTKGCYVGQEVVIRVEHQGHVNKKLCGLLVAGDAVPPGGSAIHSGERAVGAVTSAIRSPALDRVIALGYVRRESWEPGTLLRILWGGRSQEAEVVSLPFVSAAGQ